MPDQHERDRVYSEDNYPVPDKREPWTPGPWEPFGLDWRTVVDGVPSVIADVRTTDADARLIAAAPEMATLLAEAVALWDRGQDTTDNVENEARALLARIRGEA